MAKKQRRGVTMLEYGLLASLLVGGVTMPMMVYGGNMSATYCRVARMMPTSTSNNCSVVTSDQYNVPNGIDPQFVPVSQGGQDGSFQGNQGLMGGLGDIAAKVLENINATDPIKGLYGMKFINASDESNSIGNGYNPTGTNGNSVESYQTLLDNLKSGQYTWGDNSSDNPNAQYNLMTKGTNAWNNDPNVPLSTFEQQFNSGQVPSGTAGTNGDGTMFQVVTASGRVLNVEGAAYLLANNTSSDSGAGYQGVSGTNLMRVVDAKTGEVVSTGSGNFNMDVHPDGSATNTTTNVTVSGPG